MRSLVGEILPRRSPTNESPVPYTSRARHGLFAALSGHGATLDRERQAGAMEGNGSLFAIVGGIAVDTSAVEWHMHRKVRGSADECPVPNCDAVGVELVEAHAALDVWENPNPFMGRQELVEQVQQHLDLTGEGWPLFSLAGRLPVEIWPIYPHRMTPVPDRKKFLAGYVYSSPDGEQVPLGVNEVGLLRQPHPLDVMRGLSAVGAIGVDLGTASAARAWNRNFFLNSAEPGGIIEVPRRLTEEEFEEMSARWREQHQGVSAAHRVAIIEGENTRWVDRRYTMRDMQFAELLGVSDEAVRKAYRYPKSLLGDSNDVNRAVAEAQEVIYGKRILEPRLNRWKGMLNRKFLPQYGSTARDHEFAYASPVPVDREAQNAERVSRTDSFKHLVEAGVDGTDALAAMGLPDMKWVRPERVTGGSGGGWGWNAAPDRTFLNAAMDGDKPIPTGERMSPAGIAGMVQRLYLGTEQRAVVTWEEARSILNAAGAELDLTVPAPARVDAGDRRSQSPATADESAGDPFAAAIPHLHAAVARRIRNAVEERAEVDPDAIQQEWETVLDGLIEDWQPILDAQLAQLDRQVRDAAESGDLSAVTRFQVSTSRGADVLAEAMDLMAQRAERRAVAEARAQGVQIANTFRNDVAAWHAVALAIDALISAGLLLVAGRETLRWMGYGKPADETAEAVLEHVRETAGKSLRSRLGSALTWVQNKVRLATFRRAPKTPKYYASEANDGSTCAKCAAIDGQELPTFEAATLAYGGGGYLFCLGLDRCRGTAIAVWD